MNDEFNCLLTEYGERFDLEMEALFEGAIMLGPILHSYNFEQNLKRWQKAKDEMRKFYD